jgi:nitroimidazol reductase NimA-like FMN-containing flavoprotein (pyridoxamine 5'-phosphate oxidase superfamily)
MRRNRQQLSREECERILGRCTSGVLALAGDGGYPYAVPLSYVYADGAIIFHSAVQGHKVDAIKRDSRCSFCVIEQDEIRPAEFTTYFKSVIAFGRIHILEGADEKVQALRQRHEALLMRPNHVAEGGNGIYEKYVNPILTAEHTPLEWRYDFCEQDNPFLMQRIMMNAVLNAGAIKLNGKYLLIARVEGADRKSFFAVAESPNGIDQWRFWDEPVTMPDNDNPATISTTCV